MLVKEVKVKKLPEVTDEWAAESSEFETVAELRADIADRIGRVKLMQSQMALRQKTIEALAGLVTDDDVPEVLVDAEVNERLHDLQHRLEAQKVEPGRVPPGHGHVARRPAAVGPGATPRRRSRPTWRCGPWSRPRS